MPKDISYPVEAARESLVHVVLVGEAPASDPLAWSLLTRGEHQAIAKLFPTTSPSMEAGIKQGSVPHPRFSSSDNREAYIRVPAGSYVVYVFYAPNETSLDVETLSTE